MKKIILICLIATGLFAEKCEINYNTMVKYTEKFQKATAYGLTNEALAIVGMIDYYSSQTMIECDESNERFKHAQEIKQLVKKSGLLK